MTISDFHSDFYGFKPEKISYRKKIYQSFKILSYGAFSLGGAICTAYYKQHRIRNFSPNKVENVVFCYSETCNQIPLLLFNEENHCSQSAIGIVAIFHILTQRQ